MHDDFSSGPLGHELAIVARELDPLIDRLADAAATARGLADATRWRARAATAFHDRATTWAGDVSGLACLAETARLDTVRMRERVALLDAVRADRLLPGVPR